ncbi:protein FAR1-RELATED SEQUENCE 4-like [Cucumis melo var. makuwa]|uniref:Protein FAR1-RELATED SEQUENCE 4-like n=1 Tax=Cucumis melo var. makuwa TaxID=1194695 RepID=A0A5D3CTS7_CUCMM|nr:protein FAR1-RELATED SEQUENCE 4-like [Cucumis melo var. makuwa]
MSIPIVVYYGGQWNGCNVYENYSVSGILVDMRVNFNSLVSLICEQLELDESVELSVLLDFGKSNVQTVVSIKKDNDVAWYLAFVKDATSRHPLVPHKAWRAKEHMVKILHGDTVESYALILGFFDKLVESNPGTCIALEMDDSGHFKFCFMAFGASIEGWKYCRPIISVDGTFLKCKFGGIPLTASSQDSNNQIFPLAFAIVDSENDASWTWHVSIVFPDVEYCVCTEHLLSNLKLHFKDPLLDKYFFSCTYAYTVEELEYHMRCIESVCSNIRDYLSSVGFEKWSRTYSRDEGIE